MPNFGVSKRMPAGGESDLRSAKQQNSTKKLKTKRLIVPILPVPDVSQKKTVTTQKSVRTLVTPPPEVSPDEGQARLAYSILMRLLECGKGGEKGMSATIKSEEIVAMLDFAKPVFMGQPSCVEIDGPISICGDVHGQFSDLLRLFDKAGFPTRTNYLFLGDYVDRGRQSLETILMLLAYKLIFPVNFFLLRGNHECPTINKVYGFYDECTRRLGRSGIKVWTAFQDTFATMPLTALVGEKILCMHGGLSPRLKSLDQLRQFRRPNYQPDHASMEIDILWSDPSNFTKGWSSNQRGVSYVFGPSVVHKLLDSLNIDLVVRAHQVVQDGYEFFAQRRLVTIFSAPFYCGQFDNAAAVMIVTEELVCSFQILRPRKFLPKRRLGAPKKASKVLVF